MRRRLQGSEDATVAESLNLGSVFFAQGKLAEAESTYREALMVSRKLLGNEHPDLIGPLNSLGNVLNEQEKPAEAESEHREALLHTVQEVRRELLRVEIGIR